MSSRALRRLREEKEAAMAAADEGSGDDDESSEEEEEDAGGGGGKGGFMMMLEEESSEEESSESESDDDDDGADDNEPSNKAAVPAPPTKSKKGGKPSKEKEEQHQEEEEDLDAILSDMNIQSSDHRASDANDSTLADALPTIRSYLLSKQKGFDVQDLDLDYAMRSLVGGPAAIGGDDFMGGQQQQQQQQGGRRQRGGGGQQRGRRTLAKKYLFGKPRTEWGKPPSYVGGGIGMKELTKEALEEERHSWSIPWPYNLGNDGGGDDNNDNNDIPAIPISEQKWYTLQMSDTYKEQDYIYQQMLSSSRTASRQQAGLHDPNSLAMFVSDHPYFAETTLQLAMVLYYINDRGRGNDLLRRCMFLYESALPSNVLPSNDGSSNNNSNNNTTISGGGNEILIDIDRQPNSGLFAALFRIMQTSGMTGCHNNALATGRFLLSLDPLRDPMGVLLILDYYALASRRTSSTYHHEGSGTEVEVGAAFIVELVELDFIKIHYKDPLTDRHHWCRLVDMPNWAYSYALALYRLSMSDDNDDDSEERYMERAEDALTQALERYPMVLSKLLAMNKVNTQDRSFRMDWPAILPYFNGDANAEANGANDSVEERVTKASGEHLLRIFVQRCHKLWKEDSVVQWMYQCSVKVVQEREQKCSDYNGDAEGEGNGQTVPSEADTQDEVSTAPANNIKNIPPLITSFSPALARYAQCDPSEYEDAFQTFPPEAIALDPNLIAPAMALGPNGRRGRFLRRGQQQQRGRMDAEGGGQDPLEIVRQMLGMGDGAAGMLQEVEALDPDSPILALYLQSLLPWAQVEGVRPPPRG